MKKLLIISILFSLVLTGCNAKKTKNSIIEKPLTKSNKIESSTSDNTYKNIDIKMDKETLMHLIKDSDYISRINVQATTKTLKSINFIKDYKGDLSNIQINLSKFLKPNKEYLIFYKDNSKGEIVPSRDGEAFIELENSNDKNLNIIENYFNKDLNKDLNKDSNNPIKTKKDK